MDELDLGTILKVAESEKVAVNAISLTDLLKYVDKLIQEGDKILGFINRLERSSLVGTLMRAQMKKAGVDVAPLTKDIGIIPTTNIHAQILENINNLNEHQLKELMQAIAEYEKKKSETKSETDADYKDVKI